MYLEEERMKREEQKRRKGWGWTGKERKVNEKIRKKEEKGWKEKTKVRQG